VIDNAGGRIFDQLPVKKLYAGDDALARLWLTPARRELSHAAALFGLAYQAPTTPAEICAAVSAALATNRATLLHLRVGAGSAAEMRQNVLAAVSADLAKLWA